ncbi:hypothetical protein LEP1GSC151_2774 [Leptospira interrogans serovar Grippotyphosa str. LT2186]|uniref:Uncharacterized protein n=1 Tax=Leptospira interrogans serovar Grippotyphosa str. LT2186 TaxID=1001599 RepID=M3I8J7_LEPIR|nr:hypothetical protein [Leptospira interrogans]EJP12978.1 hypothetical protein LEP1GSC080_0802 [Leptospira interrogans str. FPW2026]EKR45978.1 hypothetical protein LEP1GSC097_0967 [Leptospira interrogans serovar Grippotyphosa str. UI 08368]EMG12137.1 hypothetical protein LEP1GSC151_2774 [Leptospira interrogans serovar Grippotyphosa str. LT2186]EMN83654.1 hypothetical protein LEP1GSC107_1236 [Leptospira interrogans serovar Grippotyphosa str. UI 12769]
MAIAKKKKVAKKKVAPKKKKIVKKPVAVEAPKQINDSNSSGMVLEDPRPA